MPRKKIKIKKTSKNNGLGKIASLTTKSIGKAFANYKKNKELQKIKLIKLQKLEEKNEILKERKDLKNWEEKLNKESNKIKMNEEDFKIREKKINSLEEKQKIEDAMSPLKDKQKEIDKHCRGELSFRKVTEDCAALEELEKLKDDQKSLRRQM